MGCDPIIDGVAGGAAIPSARAKTWSLEDWMGEQTLNGGRSTQQGYVTVNAANATLTHMGSFVGGSHPGTVNLNITIDASSRVSKRQALAGVVLGSGRFFWETCLRVNVLPSAGDAYILQAGMIAQAGVLAQTADGVYFFADTNSANWRCKTAQAGVRQDNDSTIPIAINTWYTLAFEVDTAASVVNYFIDGVFVATEALNIPTVATESTCSITGPAGGMTQGVTLVNDFIYWEKDFVPLR